MYSVVVRHLSLIYLYIMCRMHEMLLREYSISRSNTISSTVV